MFIIIGQYRDHEPEEIDTADGPQDARIMVGEYRMAFGPEWQIWFCRRR